MSYFNTNKEAGKVLADSIKKNQAEDKIIMGVFETYSRPFSWCQIMDFLPCQIMPGNVKRSLSSLSRDKLNKNKEVIRKARLIKTEEMEMGIYGKKVHLYRLA